MNETPVAGVDVSKEFSDMWCILAPDNTVFERVKVYHNKTSLGRAVKALDRASRTFGEKPVVVMESTSRYHRLLCQFLVRYSFCHVLNRESIGQNCSAVAISLPMDISRKDRQYRHLP